MCATTEGARPKTIRKNVSFKKKKTKKRPPYGYSFFSFHYNESVVRLLQTRHYNTHTHTRVRADLLLRLLFSPGAVYSLEEKPQKNTFDLLSYCSDDDHAAAFISQPPFQIPGGRMDEKDNDFPPTNYSLYFSI